MNNGKLRLQKYLSLCGVASRRKSEELISQGEIKVNNVIITGMGYCVSPEDIVEYKKKIIKPLDKKYLILNKPAGYICSKSDPADRKTVYDIVKDKSLFYIGRLDYDTSGILIMTNDGDFANSIAHPSNKILKRYLVESYDQMDPILIKSFKKGILIDNIIYKAENIEIISINKLKIDLYEGKKREIRMVYKKFKIKIKSLKRFAIGAMILDELNIKEGKYKSLTLDEIKRKIYGE
jgi:23S rRNA pseudouridine2605 synthase